MGVKLHDILPYDIVVTLSVFKCTVNSTNVSNAAYKYVIVLLVALRLNMCYISQ
jgi:hypothetical protein